MPQGCWNSTRSKPARKMDENVCSVTYFVTGGRDNESNGVRDEARCIVSSTNPSVQSGWYAHTPNDKGEWHDLVTHLTTVSKIAEVFATNMGIEGIARIIGLFHDCGKFTHEFQMYLRDPTMKRENRDHSTAGAVHLLKQPLGIIGAFVVAGHHSGLPDRAALQDRMKKKQDLSHVLEAIDTSLRVFSKHGIDIPEIPSALPAHWSDAADHPEILEVFIRMLFSCLVDADRLDTEAHACPNNQELRGTWHKELNLMLASLREWNQRLHERSEKSALNQARQEVYEACLHAAGGEPGIYTLNVPTGFGKTLAGVAFGFEHAARYRKNRVIVAMPYTSIIDQNAKVYRQVFGDDAVLEHHSMVERNDEVEVEDRRKLAAENWDVPLIVTSTVQLFESLFSSRPAAVRKLHNIANSVIVLDEVQMLPLELLDPCFSMMSQLVQRFGVTILLSTATPIATELTVSASRMQQLQTTDVVPDVRRFFSGHRRVEYDLTPLQSPWSWERTAQEALRERQAMVIVNRRSDAARLFHLMAESADCVYHLSASMCAVHRMAVLDTVRTRLKNDESVLLVATQVVEAGVDIDFPVVMRALGPLDRIAQAAGRCNREGKLKSGRMVVFVPQDGGLPIGSYKVATEQTLNLLLHGQLDLHEPGTYEAYFRQLYGLIDVDKKQVQSLRTNRNSPLQFAEIDKRFRMIDDDSITLVIPYEEKVNDLVNQVERSGVMTRDIARKLQRYTVNVYQHQTTEKSVARAIHPFADDWYLWTGKYDDSTGIAFERGVRAYTFVFLKGGEM